jgi:hypothetical protein
MASYAISRVPYLAALDELARTAVSCCGFASMKSVRRAGVNDSFGKHILRWRTQDGVGDLLAAVAPRAFLAVNGAANRIFRIDRMHDSYAVARPAYVAACCGVCLALDVYPGPRPHQRDSVACVGLA